MARFDQLGSIRAVSAALLFMAPAIVSGTLIAGCTQAAEPVVLANFGGQPVHVLRSPVEAPVVAADRAAMSGRLRQAGSSALILVLFDVKTTGPAGATYNVFLGPEGGETPLAVSDARYAGTFGLFDVPAMDDPRQRTFGFDVTTIVRGLAVDDFAGLTVTIVPVGADAPDISIAAIRLEQR